jgi:hypothetical protein
MATGVRPIQLPHAYRKISIGCINKQMVMIPHQAIGVAEPIVRKGNTRKGIQEHLSVLIVYENLLSFVSSTRDMIDSSRKFYTQGTCHGLSLYHHCSDYVNKIDLTPSLALFIVQPKV